jgi:glycine cleavage system regulatory protein
MELILTIMANDRPGIAERLAREIESHQGNWLESRMATMAGKFAGIVRIDVPQENSEAVQKALQSLRDEGLSVQIELGESNDATYEQHTVKIIGNDRPGIVREVTNALASIGVNVIDLQTEIEQASMSGGSLFKADIAFTLDTTQSMDLVVKALEDLSPDLMVDE